MGTRSSSELEEGWAIVQIGFTNLINTIEGVPESPVDADYWMKLYTTVYTAPRDYSKQLNQRYECIFTDYLASKVLPAIQEKHDDVSLLQEFVRRWANHKVMVSKFSRYFSILDLLAKYQQQPIEVFRKPGKGSKKGCMRGKGGPENLKCKYRGVRQRTWGKWVSEIRKPNGGGRLWLGTFDTAIEAAQSYDDASRRMYGENAFLNFPDAKQFTESVSEVCSRVKESKFEVPKREPVECDVGFGCFREIVYEKMKVKVKDVVISLINRERQGNEIDRGLVKDVLEVFVEIGNENGKDNLDYYVNDFETAFLTDMVDYYTRKGSDSITAIECLQMEKDRVSYYLHFSTEEKLLKQVQGQVLTAESAQQVLD
ncbi:hypothetical protein MKX01_000323 [Papaver californicum]|nr:hypothetical protein MKX01_000323 [Papaver californicum]